MKEAIIILTRVPIAGKTKTRLMPVYTAKECAEIHAAFLKDIYTECKKTEKDIFIFYTPDGAKEILTNLLGTNKNLYTQTGDNLGERMLNAIQFVLTKNFDACVLIGSDIPEISAEILSSAFLLLKDSDVVMCPVSDGGYCLVGMKQVIRNAFELQNYGTTTVFESTVKQLTENNHTVALLPTLNDIDTPQDVLAFLKRLQTNKNTKYKNTREYFTTHKKISVIIPIYNEAKQIIQLQNELQKLPACEIIFADGGSTDETLDLIDKQYTVIKTDKGRAKQMNAAAHISSGAILFFLHADSIIPNNTEQKIQEATRQYRFGCFRIAFNSQGLFFAICTFMSNLRATVFKYPFGDQGIFVERNLFFESGGFPDIPIMEDYQFSINMKNKKEKLVVINEKIISSARRFNGSFFYKLKLSMQMFFLRFAYRRGKNIDDIAKQYKDIR
jgi:hypothetical protein